MTPNATASAARERVARPLDAVVGPLNGYNSIWHSKSNLGAFVFLALKSDRLVSDIRLRDGKSHHPL